MASPSLEIVPSAQLGSSVGTLYTSPLATVTRIEKVTYTNTDTATHTVTVYLIPSGQSASTSNLITDAQAVGPSQSLNDVNIPGHYLNAGDKIAAFADTASVVNIAVGGTQIT
jgi:hypothetical protein